MENIKEDEKELSASEILRNLKNTDPDVRTLLSEIMFEERKVMYNERRPNIHKSINNHIQRLIK